MSFNVLFVCTANICRSLYAEGRARQLLGTQHALTVASGGTHGFTDHEIDFEMARQLAHRGQLPQLRSRRLTADIVRTADLILTAEVSHRAYILDEWPLAARKVFTFTQFAEALPRCTDPKNLVAEAYKARGPASRSGDIADSYRRGTKAAADAAAHIDSLLEATLPALLRAGENR